MVSFGHTGVGAVMGLLAYQLEPGNPVLGLGLSGALGVGSHYLSDLLPHGHFTDFSNREKLKVVLLADLGVSLVLMITLSFFKFGFSWKFFYILFGIGGAQLPDIIHGLYYMSVLKGRIFQTESRFHKDIHWFEKGKVRPWSLWDIWQVALFLICLIIIFR